MKVLNFSIQIYREKNVNYLIGFDLDKFPCSFLSEVGRCDISCSHSWMMFSEAEMMIKKEKN